MRTKIRTFLLLLPLLAASCSSTDTTELRPATGSICVTVGSGPRIDVETQTRTELGDDGQTIRWAEGDQIALWAVNSQAEHTLSAQPFEMLHYNQTYDDAKFTATISAMPPQETYAYYATSPLPAATEGLKASYDIPAVQDGAFDGAYDVMVAAPVTGGGPLAEGDNSDAVNLQFTHKVHVLMIRIPSSALDEPIEELTLTFPTPVTGRLTVDASDPLAAPELTGGSNTLTLRFPQPVEAAEDKVVYAVIAPVEFTDTDAIEIKAAGQTCESKPAYMAGKHFTEGHTTPIRLNVPEKGKVFTYLHFTLEEDGTGTLGEPIRSFTLTAPEGSAFDNGSNVRTFEVDGPGDYSIRFTDFEDNLSGRQIAVSYESDHAIVAGEPFTMPQLTAETSNGDLAGLKVPYLMEEDFSRCSDFKGPEQTGNASGTELSNEGLPGWYAGARSVGTAGTSVDLRSYSNAGGPYHSRIDSSPLSNIKSGKTIRVKIVFNADWKKNKSSAMELIIGRTSEHTLNASIYDATTLSLSNNSEASPTNIPTLHNVYVANLTSEQSIAWKTSGKNGTWFQYDDLYIDNVKVSIVPES